jgi:hypothetical protein
MSCFFSAVKDQEIIDHLRGVSDPLHRAHQVFFLTLQESAPIVDLVCSTDADSLAAQMIVVASLFGIHK